MVPLDVTDGPNTDRSHGDANARGWRRVGQKLKLMGMFNKYLRPTERQARQQRELEHRNIVKAFQTRAIATLKSPGKRTDPPGNLSPSHSRPEVWYEEENNEDGMLLPPQSQSLCNRAKEFAELLTVEHFISIILIVKMISVPFMWAFSR